MLVDVVQLPRDLTAAHVAGRAVVVFDVLRATTTMAAALACGVREIVILPDVEAVRAAAGAFGPDAITCGERDCLPPPGFTLGNSPGGFTPAHAGRTAFMSTTNGTRAIIAAAGAARVFAGALVNAAAVARAVGGTGLDATLLCAGTGGAVAMEDLIGAGAVLDALHANGPVVPGSDVTLVAHDLFRAARPNLRDALARTLGGRNVLAAGLGADIDFAAQINALDVVGVVEGEPLRLRKL